MADPAEAIRILFVVYRERSGESSLEGILVAAVNTRATSHDAGRNAERTACSMRGNLGGRRTHLPRRGRYGGDLGRTSGFPVRAGHAHHPQHSIPLLYIFPRGVNSPHPRTIGRASLVSQERSPARSGAAHLSLSTGHRQTMKPREIDAHIRSDRTKCRSV